MIKKIVSIMAMVFTVLWSGLVWAQSSEILTISSQGTFGNWCLGAGASKPAAMAANDDATSYIYQDGTTNGTCQIGAGAKESYVITNTTGSTSIDSVVVRVRAIRVGAGTQTIKWGVLSGGTEGYGADQNLTTSWATYSRVFTTDPNTGAAWTCAAVDAAEWLIQTVAVSDLAGRLQQATYGEVQVYYAASGSCAAAGGNGRRPRLLRSGG